MRRPVLVLLVTLTVLISAQAHPQSDQPQPATKQSPYDSIAILIEQRRYNEAIARLEDALRREPNAAGLYEQLGKVYFATGRYEEAVAACDRAIRLNASLLQAYPIKWESMMKRPDFESQADFIRPEIEKLLADNKSERALDIAAKGFELLADERAVQKVHDRVIAEYPNSEWAQSLLGSRAFAEPDGERRAALFEAFVVRYPDDARAGMIYADLFRTRAKQPLTTGKRLRATGDAWIRHVGPTAYAAVAARVKVALVLAERQTDLAHAEAIADEAANEAHHLTVDSPQLAGEPAAGREAFLRRLSEDVQMALGFVHMRQGRIAEAAIELSGPLAPVIKQVERDGYILWKDADLREFGLRPRVLWLAELFEAEGDYRRAAKYLLAGTSDNDQDNHIIQSRLSSIYARLGRSQQEAINELTLAVQRYLTLTTPTLAMREEDKRRLLATRTELPAPDFKAIGLDKKEVRLVDFKGKVAVLVFWATWCGPCVAELPHFQEAAKKYAANPNVTFLAISTDERKLAVRRFIEGKGYRLPVAYDVNGATAFAVQAIPSLIIIDRKGRLAYREQGFGSQTDRYVEQLSWRIDELLKEPANPDQEGR